MKINLVKRVIKYFFILILVMILTFFGVRIYDSQQGLSLEIWHTYIPDEPDAKKIDNMDLSAYLLKEQQIFKEIKDNVIVKSDEENALSLNDIDGSTSEFNFLKNKEPDIGWFEYFASLKSPSKQNQNSRIPLNRYIQSSAVYPGNFEHDWNRSYIMMPDGEPRGAAVLLHGLTDTPYSLRHIANLYREKGFLVISIRLPGHGTVPAALSAVHWQDWLAATRLSIREAKQLSGLPKPLHLVGFSNGGALAMKYALDALEDPNLAQPQQIILVSPMIGVTAFARFAGLAGLPAIFPPFAKAAWVHVLPEFNPFKYNSFPVNGARQSYLLTDALQEQIAKKSRENSLKNLPPILTFQSVVDFTVRTQALMSELYNKLPLNGSEVVLFDINRSANFDILIKNSAINSIQQLLAESPRNYETTLITNISPINNQVVARSIKAGETEETITALNLVYPSQLFSLSHVAIPFPESDSLYGANPNQPQQYGISLGSLAVRGERSVLMVDLDTLLRASSNPFFPYMEQRILADIDKSLNRKN